ncbi:MAG: serine/threonine protein kinase [Planctomycetes bacterium]|nr:serine/threonine protein kinase [Planctomycetota bacterium]
MSDESPANPSTSAEVRARLSADVAAGKTISLSTDDLARPEVRANLPHLLEELAREAHANNLGPAVPGYTLLAAIGQGGMSTVYLAHHHTLDRHVALKVGTHWRTGDDRARERLLEEARLLARVQHANIVTIHDVIELEGTIAIAMEWVDGLTLAGLLRALPRQHSGDDLELAMTRLGTPDGARQRFATTPVRFFVRTALDVARALHCAHGNGILHLDVKPSNVLLRRDGTPLLADFGIGREWTTSTVATATFAGTPVYSAPEQLKGGGRIGPHTDVYALGMTLYEALARTQPLLGLDLPELIATASSGRLPPLSSLVPIAKDIETVVHKAIDPDPARRYHDAAALADDLQAFLAHRPVSARPLTRAERLRRWARQEPWKAALVAVLLLTLPALAALTGYLTVQRPRIEKQLREEQQAQASALRQAAYRAYFVQGHETGEPTELMQRALELDPSDTSFACLVMMLGEEGSRANANQLLTSHGERVARHRGLQLLATKYAAGRAFFVAEEVAALRTSEDPLDRYVLALDRTFRAEDAPNEDHYAEAAARLADVNAFDDIDPLVLGLQAWCTLRAGDRDGFDSICRAMTVRWRHDINGLAWRAIALEPVDAAAAEGVCRELIAQHPQDARCHELLVGWASRNRPDEAPALAQAAAAANATTPRLELLALLPAALRDADRARVVLQRFADRVNALTRLRLLHTVAPERARAAAAAIVATPAAGWHDLEAAFAFAAANDLTDLAARAFANYQASFPDRRSLHPDRIAQLVRAKDYATAAPLARDYRPARRALSNHAPFLCRIFMFTGDWHDLAAIAARWLAATAAEDRAEPAYYHGLALSRLGRHREAAMELGRATAVIEDKRSWFPAALLESAWLKVAPEVDDDLHDVQAAAHLVALVDTIAPANRSRGAWASFVRAEVAFANGDKGTAQSQLASVDLRARDPVAPTDLAERVQKARERLLRK